MNMPDNKIQKSMINYHDLTISRDLRKHIGQASDSVPADAPAGPEAFDRKRHPTELLHYTSSNQFLQNSRSRASHHLSPLTSWLSVCYTTVFSVATPIGIRPVTATPGPNGKPLSSWTTATSRDAGADVATTASRLFSWLILNPLCTN